MEALNSFLLAIFIAILLGVAATFGFVLILWFVGLAALGTLLFLLRQWWLRGVFLYHARDRMPPPPPPAPKKPQGKTPRVIDAEYEEIED